MRMTSDIEARGLIHPGATMVHRRPSLAALLALALLAGCRFKSNPDAVSQPLAASDGSGVIRVDLDNVDSLGEPTSGPECRADSDSVVCRAQQGREDVFHSWDLPEDVGSEGDHVRFGLRGLWKGSHRFQLIRVELGHDAPDYLLWNVREGGWILIQPGHDSLFVGKDRNSILVRRLGGNDMVHWDYWNQLDGALKRYSCVVSDGGLSADSVLSWRGLDGSQRRLDAGQMQNQPHMGCTEATPVLESVLPGYMEEPRITDPEDEKAQ